MSLVLQRLTRLVSLQDLGRRGQRHLGVSWNGAMDQLAFESANWLCGNRRPTPCLELGAAPVTLTFEKSGHFAYCGPTHHGELSGGWGAHPIHPGWRYPCRPGDCLTLVPGGGGMYGYLAVAGGLRVPPLLGSCSSDDALGVGDLPGRPLAKGDRLAFGEPPDGLPTPTAIAPRPYRLALRYLPAPGVMPEALSGEVSSAVSRMGVRLSAPPLPPKPVAEQTRPVFPGAIQLPSDGQPIILTRGCQTTGGYPVLGYMVQPDLDDLAQAPPGSRLTLSPCTLERALEARRRYQAQRYLLQRGLYGTGSER